MHKGTGSKGTGWEGTDGVFANACNAATFARVPIVADCQARMFTNCTLIEESSWSGFCRSPASLAAESVRRLGTFGFVGLVEDWETSVELFHHVYGGTTVPSELLNSRPTHGNVSTGALPDAGCGFIMEWHDEGVLAPTNLSWSVPPTPVAELEPLDTALYAAAVPLFYDRARAAGLLSAAESAVREKCLLSRVGNV